MKILHILKTAPDDNTKTLMAAFGRLEGDQVTIFELYHDRTDYQKLIDLIFENDKVISWW